MRLTDDFFIIESTQDTEGGFEAVFEYYKNLAEAIYHFMAQDGMTQAFWATCGNMLPQGGRIMKIITIGRQFGSGGRELGKRLSDVLGFDYYDREIITSIAEKYGMNDVH